jgi:hypothetical protein
MNQTGHAKVPFLPAYLFKQQSKFLKRVPERPRNQTAGLQSTVSQNID